MYIYLLYISIYICTHIYIYLYIYIYMYIYTYVYIFICIYIYICIDVSVYTYSVYLHIHIHMHIHVHNVRMPDAYGFHGLFSRVCLDSFIFICVPVASHSNVCTMPYSIYLCIIAHSYVCRGSFIHVYHDSLASFVSHSSFLCGVP